MAADFTVDVVVQVNGRVVESFWSTPQTPTANLEIIAKACPKVAVALEGKEVIKIVIVPDRVVNFITN